MSAEGSNGKEDERKMGRSVKESDCRMADKWFGTLFLECSKYCAFSLGEHGCVSVHRRAIASSPLVSH